MNTNPIHAHPHIKVSTLNVSVTENVVAALDGKVFVAHEPFADFVSTEEIRNIANKAIEMGRTTPSNQTGVLASLCLWTLVGFDKVPNEVKFMGKGNREAVANAITKYPHVIFPIHLLGNSSQPLTKMAGALLNVHRDHKFSVVRHPHDSDYGVVFCRY